MKIQISKTCPVGSEVVGEEYVDDFVDFGIAPFFKREVVYESDPHSSVTAFLLVPADVKPGERRPAILNAHGHGSGKSMMVGLDPSCWDHVTGGPNHEAAALHLVKEGYVVLAPDWRPFGGRSLDLDFCRKGRDPCNVTYFAFAYFGLNLLALNVNDAMRSLDYLCSLDVVDPSRIGMVGKSYGGTLTAYTAALDPRVKAACVSGYLSTLSDALSMRALGNYCGAQFLPGLLEWGDVPDVLGLIAPRPLLVESGTLDDCFVFDDATAAYERLKEIYAAAGVPGKLDRDVAEVRHEYIFGKLPSFLRENLGPS